MKIYTKAGDEGKTSLIGGNRLPKSNVRVEAIGSVDELNAHIGVLRDQPVNRTRQELLNEIQENLFVIGSLLAATGDRKPDFLPEFNEKAVNTLEEAIDEMEKQLTPMKYFILPGGHPDVSACHLARCVCRRAERSLVRLHEAEDINKALIIYLNRMSDYLFVLARTIGHEHQVEEIPWKPREK
jgi:cob(I)alamin adenosyltransferase